MTANCRKLIKTITTENSPMKMYMDTQQFLGDQKPSYLAGLKNFGYTWGPFWNILENYNCTFGASPFPLAFAPFSPKSPLVSCVKSTSAILSTS